MKILFVLENYYPHIGGVETVFENLAKGLAKKGHKVDIITSKIKGTKKEESKDNYKIHRITTPQIGRRYWFSCLAIPAVLKYAENADIIHTTTYNGAPPARIASILSNKPAVITVHEVLGSSWKTAVGINWLSAKLHQFLEKLIIVSKFDCFIAVSNSTKRSLLKCKVKKEKIKVVHNGVDYDLYNPKKYIKEKSKIRKKLGLEKNFVYTYYGRPGITKGIDFLINAVPLISKKIPNSRLMLILSKSPKNRYDYILNLINKLNIRDNITLVEPQRKENLPQYIISSDCVVVPSLSEGFGFTAAEACALNVPVVASNTTSLPEVVSGKYILVEPRNPNAIAKAVEDVYKGKVKSKPKKLFTVNKNVENYLKIYKELIKK
jgi:glycosyltransferase involved in cell wall biosynthesis